MPLVNLPHELLCAIVAEHLHAESDLNAFARTNRLLYHLTNPYLYDHNIRCSNDSALLWAAKHGQQRTVCKLLEKRAWLDSSTRRLGEALVLAAEAGHKSIAHYLFNEGANVNFYMAKGAYANALQAACSEGHRQVVKMLLDKGADVNAQGGRDGNALQAASSSVGSHKQIVKMLLEKALMLMCKADSIVTHCKLLVQKVTSR
ncbi:hypothetical protein GGP41_009389 [Bipolaris sorokiniana]|uniref:F-box domain-containing protein n=2 Tax=Cochliobolus sativus TaxID=45130 RepID=A0A8H5Z8M6_COCSA|nr:hypothetical protein GGP41_009389 [Bipolaris sorokiniana]